MLSTHGAFQGSMAGSRPSRLCSYANLRTSDLINSWLMPEQIYTPHYHRVIQWDMVDSRLSSLLYTAEGKTPEFTNSWSTPEQIFTLRNLRMLHTSAVDFHPSRLRFSKSTSEFAKFSSRPGLMFTPYIRRGHTLDYTRSKLGFSCR